MKIKTQDLIGLALDWAVAQIETAGSIPNYSTNWLQGGPIIDREKIALDVEHGDPWRARFGRARITFDGRAHHYHHAEGPTPLIAAMRCYVASKLGDEVDIPEELLK